MHVIVARNVTRALPEGVELLRSYGVREETRNGPALVMPSPVTTVIEHPAERVLFAAERDANPAFHLAEAIWMLAGRNDAAFLNHFIRDFGARFAEEDGTIHGAYGHRWRRAFGVDQLDELVARLKREPNTRQAVLQMWNVNRDLAGGKKDIPCNDLIFLRNRDNYLDMTICCRSNDVIWGAYGANAVHFSILQEYLCRRIGGLFMGRMYQVSNNYHGYLSTMDKSGVDDRYRDDDSVRPYPMFTYPELIDTDIAAFMDAFDNNKTKAHNVYPKFANPWFSDVLVPVVLSYQAFRDKDWYWVDRLTDEIKAPDWRLALAEWYARRAR